jgi:HEAT repeat protein
MPASFWNLTLPLVVVTVLGSIAAAGYVVGANARRDRRRLRRQSAQVQQALLRFLSDDSELGPLRNAIARVTAGCFWTALESTSLRVRYVRWLRLSRALEANPFSRQERRALRDESPWRRALAARRLGLLRSERSRRALRKAMSRGPEVVTLAAAASLARYRDRGALRWLLRHPAALAHRPANVLIGVLRAFRGAALPEMAAALDQGLDSLRLERAVIEVLGLGRYRPARAALEIRVASGDTDLRVAAVRALGRIQAMESGMALLGALDDEAWQVRAQAARALGAIRAMVAIPALGKRLCDSSWWVRHHAAYALHDLGPEGQAALRRIAASSDDPYARDMANEALHTGFQFEPEDGDSEGGARRA